MATTKPSKSGAAPSSGAKKSSTSSTKASGANGHHTRKATTPKATPAGIDPAYSLPLLGPLLAQADRFRTQLPIGSAWNKSEAEVLRAEARALHAVAQYLETRAKQLDRLERERQGEKPRVRRVQVE